MIKKKILSLVVVAAMLMSGTYDVFAIERADSDVAYDISDSQDIPVEPIREPSIDAFSAVELASIGDNATSGEIASGSISWSFSSQGMLTLTGTGEMDDFSPGEAPWYAQKQFIRFIYISDGITTIGNNAFFDLSNAKSLYIPEGISSIGEGAFENCSELKEINPPNSLNTIGNGAFRKCSKIKKISIPAAVTNIGNSSFAGCDKLTEITVADTNKNFMSADGVLFNKDKSILMAYPCNKDNESYDIPNGVTQIAEYAFDSCQNLSKVTFPDSLLNIAQGAFNNCDGIGEITIPASVTEIAQGAFLYGMESLESINVEQNNTAYSSENGVLYNKDKTTLLRVPEALAAVDNKLTIPNSVTTIGQEAFFDCETVNRLYVPNSVKKIELAAFMYFDSLEYIKYYGTKTEWDFIEKDNFNEKLDEVDIEFLNIENETPFTMKVGEKASIKEYVNFGGNTAIEESVSYSSSNPSVAVIEGDTLIAVSIGETVVTATYVKDGEIIAATSKVKVVSDASNITSKSFTLEEGGTWDIRENLSDMPKYLLNKVTFVSTDESVVKVDNLLITAVGAGKATVFATYLSYKVRMEFTVTPIYTAEEFFKFSNGTITGYIGSDKIVKIPPTINGTTVTAIGYGAFSRSPITKVVLPDTITKIDSYAFRYCYNLTSINLNEGLKTINSYAFYYCSSLLKLTIPSSVDLSKNRYWFTGCSRLDTIIFAEGITKTGSVLNGSNVRKVVLPSTLQEISDYAFNNCSRLQEVSIPANVTKIGYSAFQYSRNLRNLSVPSNSKLTYIGRYAFYNSGLTSIKLPEGLESIDYSAFSYSKVNAIVIPNSVTSISNSAFSCCSNLSSITLGSGITCINYGTFQYCTNLSTIAIPDSVTKICDYAFNNSGVQNVTIGTNVSTIGNNAFAYCRYLKEITIPSSVTKIGSYAFSYCNRLEKINFNLGLETIGNHAFEYCYQLTSIKLPDTLTLIGTYTFRGCSRLSDIDLGNSLTSIPNYVFSGCSSLQKITIPGSVKNLGSNIFAGCTNITEVTIGEGVTNIPSYTFSSCYKLQKVTIPDSVTTIGNRAFYYCSNLEEIALGTKVKKIESYAFAYCNKLKSINIPDSVETIGSQAFYYCIALSSIDLGKNLNKIDSYAFYGCSSLESIVIPTSVTYIGTYAFAYCRALKNVTIGNGSAYIGYNAFYMCPWNPNATLVSSSYTTEENTGMSYIPLKVKYEFKEGSKASDKVIKITLSPWASLVEGSMKYNGKLHKDYDRSQGNGSNAYNYITIRVDENIGELDFCIESNEYKTISTTAEISYRSVTKTITERIGSLNCTLPAISISAPDIVGNGSVTVSGLTIPYEYVNLYIDENKITSVKASATGAYNTTLTIPNPENYRLYTIKAEVSHNNVTHNAETDVQYVANTPTLTGLKLHYEGSYNNNRWWGYRNEDYDLFNTNYKYIQWGYSGSYASSARFYSYYFTVNVTNSEQVDKVYVVSTRDGHKEYLEAKLQSTENGVGTYKTSGYFANDWSYIPNNITIEYTKVIDDVKLSLSEIIKYMSFGNGEFIPSITDYTSASFSASVTVPLTLSMIFGNRIDISAEITDVDYTTVTNETLYPNKQDYYSFPITENGKNCVISFDLTDSANAVIYIHDKSANKQIAYTMSFIKTDTDGNETKLNINDILENIDKYAVRFMNLYNLNIDIDAIIQGLSKTALEEEQLTELIKKAQELAVKKDMFILVSMVISLSNMNNISAPTDIIEYIKKLINIDIKFFGSLKLAITYRIGNEYKIRWKIDPSGYVYEGVTDNRLEGVTTTLYYVENEKIPKTGDGSYNFDEIAKDDIKQWNAEEYDQKNPLTTDANGTYRWDVPDDCHWRVEYNKKGYEPACSQWLPVPPVQTDVNIGLVSKAEPTVERVYISPNYAVVTFSKYMKPDTVINNVKIGELKYTIDYDKTKTDLQGNNYANEFTFKFDTPLTLGTSYEVSVSGAKSYADVEMSRYTGDAKVISVTDFGLTSVTQSNSAINVEYTNDTINTMSFDTICSFYDENDKMVDVKSYKVRDLAALNKLSYSFEFEKDWAYCKIFTWDSFNNAKPILPVYGPIVKENKPDLTNVGVDGKTISVKYTNNTTKTISFDTICATYNENHKVLEVKSFDITDLVVANEASKSFEFENDWVYYKIFTWDSINNAKPVIDVFDSRATYD